MRKLIHIKKLELEHGHGGVFHQQPEEWRGGNPTRHALAVLEEFGQPDFIPSHENLLRVYGALAHLVTRLAAHAGLPLD